MWNYRFSQLKGSSDDGKTKLQLQFLNTTSQQIETRVGGTFILYKLQKTQKVMWKSSASQIPTIKIRNIKKPYTLQRVWQCIYIQTNIKYT